jgi:predicted ABC-type ATPase
MPIVTMIAGPNGSGKSTLTRELGRRGIRLGTYLNADDIAATMSGDPQIIAAAAQQVVRERRAEAINKTCCSHYRRTHQQFALAGNTALVAKIYG